MILEETTQGFEFFERIFDLPYPFAKYDQLFVPEFNSGAMENAGCVTHNEDYVFRSRVPEVSYERRAVTILHEMAHMWFGDLVTMTWWDDLWLNESFAEWASTLAAAEATRWDSAWTTFANTDKTWAYRQDQLPSTHPIAAEIHDLEDVEVNFDGITYAKGASVLKLLAAWVGRDEFLAGHPAVLPHLRLGQHHPGRPARQARGDLGPRPQGLVGRVAGDRGRQHAATRSSRPTTRAASRRSPWCRPRRRHGRPCARTGWPSASTTAPTPDSCAATGSSSTSPARGPTLPELVGVARPDLSWSTTTTSPTPRSGSTSGRWRR